MSELIGVTSIREFYRTSLKQEALIFNKISVPWVPLLVKIFPDPGFIHPLLPDAKWLLEQGVIVDPDVLCGDKRLTSDREYQKYKGREEQLKSEVSPLDWDLAMLKAHFSVFDSMLNIKRKEDPLTQLTAKVDALYSRINELQKRRICIALRKIGGMSAVPISYNHALPASRREAKQAEILQILLKSMPIPDDATPWEQIIEFRKDADSMAKFLALRNWMNETARAKLTPVEVEEKLEYLMSQYQRHMQLHKMKTNPGTLETILVSSAEILENLIKFKFSKLAKALFTIRHRKISLIEGELTSPGSEMAYMIKTRETFQTS